MKNILIFSQTMELGGAERSLLGLLEAIDYTNYSVDLFLMHHKGELLRFLPKEVNILPEVPQYAALGVPIKNVLKNKLIRIAAGRAIGKIRAKKFVKLHNMKEDNGVELEYSHKYTKRFMPCISNRVYDLAISFLTPHYFVLEKVSAKKKIAWIHTDYSSIEVDIDSEKRMWSQYDYIAAISDDCSNGFLSKFPDLKDKIIRIENILPERLIQSQAKKSIPNEMEGYSGIRLLSIGRFCRAKNFDNVSSICSYILDSGIDIKWYIIGYGNDEQLIRDKIKEASMEDHVIIIGKKDNPYPYIKACDVYVQPSRYEGKCVSVIEAQTLGKPVVITRYLTSSSQLEDGIDGIIVPMDNQGCAEGIVSLMGNSALMNRLSENCLKRDYSKSAEVKKIYDLVNKL